MEKTKENLIMNGIAKECEDIFYHRDISKPYFNFGFIVGYTNMSKLIKYLIKHFRGLTEPNNQILVKNNMHTWEEFPININLKFYYKGIKSGKSVVGTIQNKFVWYIINLDKISTINENFQGNIVFHDPLNLIDRNKLRLIKSSSDISYLYHNSILYDYSTKDILPYYLPSSSQDMRNFLTATELCDAKCIFCSKKSNILYIRKNATNDILNNLVCGKCPLHEYIYPRNFITFWPIINKPFIDGNNFIIIDDTVFIKNDNKEKNLQLYFQSKLYKEEYKINLGNLYNLNIW